MLLLSSCDLLSVIIVSFSVLNKCLVFSKYTTLYRRKSRKLVLCCVALRCVCSEKSVDRRNGLWRRQVNLLKWIDAFPYLNTKTLLSHSISLPPLLFATRWHQFYACNAYVACVSQTERNDAFKSVGRDATVTQSYLYFYFYFGFKLNLCL